MLIVVSIYLLYIALNYCFYEFTRVRIAKYVKYLYAKTILKALEKEIVL
jgi:hypothetical protein